MLFVVLFFIFLILPACAPAAPWAFGDLRALDPIDAPDSTLDLIAVYTRAVGMQQQIRLDFLDLAKESTADITLIVATPSNTQRILISAATVFPLQSPLITRSASQDTLTLTLTKLPASYTIQVFVSPAGSAEIADSSEIISSTAISPAPVRVLLAFTDTFPATTPAQILRRWDGAHTGPYGERHGLKNLLLAASQRNLPLALLDLKAPASLSALDAAGGSDLVRSMAHRNLLILPEVFYGDSDIFFAPNVDVSRQFGLPVSNFLFGSSSPQPGYHSLDIILPDAIEQTTPDGLTLATRQELLDAALSTESNTIILGGSLPNSTWGDNDAVTAGMDYLVNHPWIRVVDAEMLEGITFKGNGMGDKGDYQVYTSQGENTGLSSSVLEQNLLLALPPAPSTPLSLAPLHMYAMLTAPVPVPGLAALKAQYLGEVNILKLASEWAEYPAPQQTCSVDINYDRRPECVLATERFFAVFDPNGARLAFLFWHDGNTAHEIVAPTWQFTVGLSDSSRWQPELGIAGDPNQIAGAFVDETAPFQKYSASLNPDGSLTFSSPDGKRIKTYSLTADGILLNYHGEPQKNHIALALDPWRRFAPGWVSAYAGNGTDIWQLENGPSVQIRAAGSVIRQFNDSAAYLFGPEDPNQAFTPGHYLPFPMAVADFTVNDGETIQLVVK